MIYYFCTYLKVYITTEIIDIRYRMYINKIKRYVVMLLKKSVRDSVIIGLIAGIGTTLVEAFVAYNKTLYFLWPWAGFFLYTPGIFTMLVLSLLLTRMYIEKGKELDANYGLYLGLTGFLVFLIFDNLIVFPIFVAPVVWPWQDFFFNFRFPVGLTDTLANGIILFMVGCWINSNYVKKSDQKTEEMIFKAFRFVKYIFIVLSVIYLPLFAVALFLSESHLKIDSFIGPYILSISPIASIILIVIWGYAIKNILKINTIDYEAIRNTKSKLIKITILNGIINEFAFFYAIIFLYPFNEERLTDLFPTLTTFCKSLIQGYLVIISFQMIFLLLMIALLMLFLHPTETEQAKTS